VSRALLRALVVAVAALSGCATISVYDYQPKPLPAGSQPLAAVGSPTAFPPSGFPPSGFPPGPMPPGAQQPAAPVSPTRITPTGAPQDGGS